MKKPRPFDRYDYYKRSVQSPEADCQFISDTFKEIRGKRPHDLREDFCGTFAICCEWARRNKHNRALGVDLDIEPITYGKTHYLSELRADQQSRIKIVQGSVLISSLAPVDVTVAFNFSYYLFKSRMMLRRYFKKAHAGIRRDGLFIVDAFGGTDTQEANEEKSKIGGFTYYWHQESFDPITNGALFHIHFKRKGERKRHRVFTYDWRLWSIPEIRDIMLEAGFTRTHVYWEGTTRGGFGNGKFKRSEEGEECNGWVAYIVGEK